MPEQTIDIARLKQTSKRAKERIEKKRAEAQARREAREAEEVEKYGRELAERIIKELPSMLMKAAREGRNEKKVIRIFNRSEKRAAEIIAAYCKERGLQTKVGHYHAGSDDMDFTHDYLLVSW